MKINTLIMIALWPALLLVAPVQPALSDDSSTPISLSVESPHADDGMPLTSESGWPIILEMTIRRDHLAADELMEDGKRTLTFESPPGSTLEVYSDVDMPGQTDQTGNPSVREKLVDSVLGGGPEFSDWNETTKQLNDCMPGTGDTDCVKAGPITEQDTAASDGFGLAADDDISGLVVLSETGANIVYQEPGFDRVDPLTLRNVAGMNNQVSFEWQDVKIFKNKGRGKKNGTEMPISKIWVSFNVPGRWIRHILAVDPCVTAEGMPAGSCTAEDALYRRDGGEILTATGWGTNPNYISIYNFNDSEFDVRAFVVSGAAPDTLADENEDGQVDEEDAKLAGFQVISNPVSFTVRQYDLKKCFGGGSNIFFLDLDNNLSTLYTDVCPSGPGKFERPPR